MQYAVWCARGVVCVVCGGASTFHNVSCQPRIGPPSLRKVFWPPSAADAVYGDTLGSHSTQGLQLTVKPDAVW